jgi:hypothetical protein
MHEFFAILFGIVFSILFIIGFLAVYLLPSYIAKKREHPFYPSILVINALLGWTILGYVAALAWAVCPLTPLVPVVALARLPGAAQKPTGPTEESKKPAEPPGCGAERPNPLGRCSKVSAAPASNVDYEHFRADVEKARAAAPPPVPESYKKKPSP